MKEFKLSSKLFLLYNILRATRQLYEDDLHEYT